MRKATLRFVDFARKGVQGTLDRGSVSSLVLFRTGPFRTPEFTYIDSQAYSSRSTRNIGKHAKEQTSVGRSTAQRKEKESLNRPTVAKPSTRAANPPQGPAKTAATNLDALVGKINMRIDSVEVLVCSTSRAHAYTLPRLNTRTQ